MTDCKDKLQQQKVLDTFFEDGKLKQLPVKHLKRVIVLERILQDFESGRLYTEKEVNGIIERYYGDYCTVRREMVDRGMMRRNQEGYWVADEVKT